MFFSFIGDGDPHRQQESDEGGSCSGTPRFLGFSCGGAWVHAPPVAWRVEETRHHYSSGLEDFPTISWIFRGYFVIFDLCNVLFDLF